MIPDSQDRFKRHGAPSAIFVPSVVAGLLLGMLWVGAFSGSSRWDVYQAIKLGMSRDEALQVVDSSGTSAIGCGAHHWETRDAVCRFEDTWREYLVGFDPATKQVNRKYFRFKVAP